MSSELPTYTQVNGNGTQPPQAGYPPSPAAQEGQAPVAKTATVVVTQPVTAVVMSQQFLREPVKCSCPHCKAEIVTTTRYENGTFSWVICLIMCVIGCAAGCCLIPFCIESCQDIIHLCPNCHQMIARWGKI